MFDTDLEILEIVDEDDRVVGTAARKEIHDHNLLHRAVHIFVFDFQGAIFVQQRSASKDRHPLRLDSSAAGHVNPGETYIEAAHRELSEELSISPQLTEIVRLPPSHGTGYEHVVLFEAVTEELPVLNRHEAVDGWFLTPAELSHAMKVNPQDFVPAFILLWDKYQGEKNESRNPKGL